MAASHEMVAPDVAVITKIVEQHPASQVLTVTNKRMIIRCTNKEAAQRVAFRISRNGYAIETKKGLKTNRFYVQAWL